MKQYVLNNLIAMDVGINTIFAGSPYETISSRMWRKRETRFGRVMVKIIDAIFSLLGQDNHCKESVLPAYSYINNEIWK